MAIYQKTKRIIHNYPAYDIIELEPAQNGAINLKAGDSLYNLKEGTKHMIGSVASSALKDGECPYKAQEHAQKHGHELYFIFGLGSCLTSHDMPREEHIGVEIGQHINFEGKQFVIVEQWNRNLGLQEITE